VREVIALVLIGLSVGAAAALWIGAGRWRAATDETRNQLQTQRTVPDPARYDARELEGLQG
jgi:hypothetical protein